MVEITQKMEGATALLGGMAVLGALSLIVIFALHSIVGTTEFTLVTSVFFVGLAADLSFYTSLPRVCLPRLL